jgi:hypothetical protein
LEEFLEDVGRIVTVQCEGRETPLLAFHDPSPVDDQSPRLATEDNGTHGTPDHCGEPTVGILPCLHGWTSIPWGIAE